MSVYHMQNRVSIISPSQTINMNNLRGYLNATTPDNHHHPSIKSTHFFILALKLKTYNLLCTF